MEASLTECALPYDHTLQYDVAFSGKYVVIVLYEFLDRDEHVVSSQLTRTPMVTHLINF